MKNFVATHKVDLLTGATCTVVLLIAWKLGILQTEMQTIINLMPI